MSRIILNKKRKVAHKRKDVPNTQEAPMDDLKLKVDPEPKMQKIQSMVVKHMPKPKQDNVSLDLKNVSDLLKFKLELLSFK